MVCLSQSPHYQRTTANKVALALSYKLVEFPINFFTSIPSFSPLKAFIVKLVATRLLALYLVSLCQNALLTVRTGCNSTDTLSPRQLVLAETGAHCACYPPQ